MHEPMQEFPPVPRHQLKVDFSSQEQLPVPDEPVGKVEESTDPHEEAAIESSEPAQVETVVIEPERPPTPPPMPKLAFDHFPAFRSSLDKPLSSENSLLIQKELSSLYSLLQAAIENKYDPTPGGAEKIKRLEATALMIQEKPLAEFLPLNAHRALMKGVQTALQESSALSEHLRNLSEKFDYKFDMNFEL
ncbi:hypothetical protein DSO57_1038654 [Entomophthora muscae]|uniref:Uncharacterized protein n=1 Tax=Entomophthora muscae TaxID=34485 RepID=A0ACC2SML7_9FUNG|nr:hypothetical protein DSO57_1038654 [Entomophthora muscae]